jgi:hypothetical protein
MIVAEKQAKFAVPALAPILLGAGGLALALASSSSTLSAKTALVVPRDFVGTSKQYADWGQAQQVVELWLLQVKDWFYGQIGAYPRTDPVRLLISRYSHAQLVADAGVDACGDGLAGSMIDDIRDELGWPATPPYKHWYVVVGAGGWAGGSTIVWEPNDAVSGFALVGDWGLKNALGVQRPFCSTEVRSNCGAFGHEITHSMGMDHAHDPYQECGDDWTSIQKGEILEHNARWLVVP